MKSQFTLERQKEIINMVMNHKDLCCTVVLPKDGECFVGICLILNMAIAEKKITSIEKYCLIDCLWKYKCKQPILAGSLPSSFPTKINQQGYWFVRDYVNGKPQRIEFMQNYIKDFNQSDYQDIIDSCEEMEQLSL